MNPKGRCSGRLPVGDHLSGSIPDATPVDATILDAISIVIVAGESTGFCLLSVENQSQTEFLESLGDLGDSLVNVLVDLLAVSEGEGVDFIIHAELNEGFDGSELRVLHGLESLFRGLLVSVNR